MRLWQSLGVFRRLSVFRLAVFRVFMTVNTA